MPLIGVSPATANVIEGQQLTLPCVLLAGNPIPDRRWIKNSMLVRTGLFPVRFIARKKSTTDIPSQDNNLV